MLVTALLRRFLEAEDFEGGAAMQELWSHIAVLDEDGDGQVSMDEFTRGVGRHSLARSVEFDPRDFTNAAENKVTLSTFLYGVRDYEGNTIVDERYPTRIDLTSMINQRTLEVYSQFRCLVPLRHGQSSDAQAR